MPSSSHACLPPLTKPPALCCPSVLLLVQTQNLMAMKRAFVSAPEVVGVLVGLLEEPLSSEARRRGRTEEETLVIELVLTLVRNLLAIQDET